MTGEQERSSLARAVEQRLGRTLAPSPSAPRLLGEINQHLCLAPAAKRFRPRLVEVTGGLFGVSGERLESVAAAAELIHAASLLHDDVVDTGTLRRGRPTANAVWGNAAAVLAGDWLLTCAFAQLEGLPHELTRSALNVVAEMSRAALAELGGRGQVMPLPEWRTMAEGKTGALFAWCGASVARLAGAEDAVPALDRFGRRLGVVFQLADDLRDFLDAGGGKDLYADVRNGNPSAVLTLAADAIPSLAQRLPEAAGGGEVAVQRLAEEVLASGSLTRALALLEAEAAAAFDAVAPHDARGELKALLDSVRPDRSKTK